MYKRQGTDYDKTGKYTGKGAFTIVEEAEGKGASLWGLLKSYQKNRNGWISLDYACLLYTSSLQTVKSDPHSMLQMDRFRHSMQ